VRVFSTAVCGGGGVTGFFGGDLGGGRFFDFIRYAAFDLVTPSVLIHASDLVWVCDWFGTSLSRLPL
jgi:hypothetical protein